MGTRESTMRMTRATDPADTFTGTVGPIAHAIFRIGIALLFMQHGVQKLFGWLGGIDGQGGTAELASQLGVAGVLEFFGGFLILIGALTQPIAVVLFLEMVTAYVLVHVPMGPVPIQNQGELALLYALSFVFLAANGAGPLSVDAAIARRRRESPVTGRPVEARRESPAVAEETAAERKERRDTAA